MALIAKGALKSKEPTKIPHTVRLSGYLEIACLTPTVCQATFGKSVGVSCELYSLGFTEMSWQIQDRTLFQEGIRGESAKGPWQVRRT